MPPTNNTIAVDPTDSTVQVATEPVSVTAPGASPVTEAAEEPIGDDASFDQVRATSNGSRMWLAFARHQGIASPEDPETLAELPKALIAEFMAPAIAKLRQMAEDAAAVVDDLPGAYRREAHPLDVRDEGKAAWVINAMKGKEDAIARVKHESAVLLKSLEADAAQFKRAFLPGLEEWTRANLVRKAQYARTMAGKVGLRNKGADLKVADGVALLHWLQEKKMTQFIKTKTETTPDWAGLKATLTPKLKPDADGEIAPIALPLGVVLIEPREEFYVEGVTL